MLDTIFKSVVETALVDLLCYGLESPNARMSCFLNKALVNIGSDLMKLVPGRVSIEVDAHLAYDTWHYQEVFVKLQLLLKLVFLLFRFLLVMFRIGLAIILVTLR